MKNKKKTILFIFIIFIFLCLICMLFLFNQRNKENLNEKTQLTSSDFKDNLYDKYNLLDCDIEEDSLTFYLSNIKTNNYEKICKNLNTIMKDFKESKNNCNQKKAIFYLYEKDIKDYKNVEEDVKIDYTLNDNSAYITTYQQYPNIEKSNGLLSYEYISFDGEVLKVSMDLSSLSLYDKISQMKTFYEVAMSLNKNVHNLVIDIQDKNIEYIYNNTSEITIIEKIKW